MFKLSYSPAFEFNNKMIHWLNNNVNSLEGSVRLLGHPILNGMCIRNLSGSHQVIIEVTSKLAKVEVINNYSTNKETMVFSHDFETIGKFLLEFFNDTLSVIDEESMV